MRWTLKRSAWWWGLYVVLLALPAWADPPPSITATDRLVGEALRSSFQTDQAGDPQFVAPWYVWMAQFLTATSPERRARVGALLQAYRSQRQTDGGGADTKATATKNAAAGDVTTINGLLGALP